MIFHIFAVKPEEYAKANKDPDYAPLEYYVGKLEAACEHSARSALNNGIKSGMYPVGSVLGFWTEGKVSDV